MLNGWTVGVTDFLVKIVKRKSSLTIYSTYKYTRCHRFRCFGNGVNYSACEGFNCFLEAPAVIWKPLDEVSE